jgi:hypothetical protein
MSITSIFDRFIFPALDWMLLDCLRHRCTQVSAAVLETTGYWIHPAFWQIDAAMLIWSVGLFLLWRKSKRGMSAGH